MTITASLALVTAVGLLAASPGPGVFATVAQSISHGFHKALALIGGIIVGDLFFLLLTIYGLAWIADLMGAIFESIRIVGGLYLIWLGINLLRNPNPNLKNRSSSTEKTWSTSFLSGLAITLGNPKVVVFYFSLLPTLLTLNKLSFFDVLLVATIVSVTLLIVLSSYALIAARSRSLVHHEGRIRRVRQSAGWMMLGSGAVVLAKPN